MAKLLVFSSHYFSIFSSHVLMHILLVLHLSFCANIKTNSDSNSSISSQSVNARYFMSHNDSQMCLHLSGVHVETVTEQFYKFLVSSEKVTGACSGGRPRCIEEVGQKA